MGLKSSGESQPGAMTSLDVSVSGCGPARRAYSSPVLTEFGRVKDIVMAVHGY